MFKNNSKYHSSMNIIALADMARAACLALLALAANAHPSTPPVTSRLTVSLIPHDGGALLARTVTEISDPVHARYGQHLSRDEALNLLTPSPDALASVKAWLRDAGVHDDNMDQQGQFLHATVSASQSASLLRKRGTTAEDLSGSYIVQEDAVRKHIRAVHVERGDSPPNRWHPFHADSSTLSPETQKKFTGDSKLKGCETKLTPACLREKYQMKGVPTTTKKTILGVIGFSGVRITNTPTSSIVISMLTFYSKPHNIPI